jgi:hypothetical protein
VLYINDKGRAEGQSGRLCRRFRRVSRITCRNIAETLPNGVTYNVLDRDTQGDLDNDASLRRA